VAREFLDVFLEELPGMRPYQDVEFAIEILPETSPISKRPYQIPPNELVKMKKQLKELEDKGFIRLSLSFWGNVCEEEGSYVEVGYRLPSSEQGNGEKQVSIS
jgi:hypothetical protein